MHTEMVARTAIARDAADLCDAMAADYRGWVRFQMESALPLGDLQQILDRPAEDEMFGNLRRQHAEWMDYAAKDPALASGMKLIDEGREVPADHPATQEDLRSYRVLMDLIRSFEQRVSIRKAVVERAGLPDPSTTEIVAAAQIAPETLPPMARDLASIAQAGGLVAGLGLGFLYLAKWRNPKSATASRQASEAAHQPGEF